MAYCEPDDVKRVLMGAETDKDGRSAADLGIDSILIEIANAQAQIDATLNGIYRVPFQQPVPLMVVSLNIDIAAYLCDLNYRKGREYESDNYPIIRRYNRAREILEWLRTGIMKLTLLSGDEPPEGSVVFRMYDQPYFSVEDAFEARDSDW